MKRILVDQDGVIADFERGFAFWFEGLFPGYRAIPLEERTTFYQHEQYAEKYPEIEGMTRKIASFNGFYASLLPIPGAIQGLNRLLEVGDVRICTSPKIDNPFCAGEKMEWIRRNLGEKWMRRTIISKDKTIIGGDILIDDNPKITGIDCPSWVHVLYDQPFNRDVEGTRMTWSGLEDFIEFFKL